MAKKETVFFALPVDEMRGKLATKQQPIVYSGQDAGMMPYDLKVGAHPAVNFRKYVVLTKTRGKNRFYVKSRTTLGVTLKGKFSQTLLGIGADIARHMYPMITSGLAMYEDIYDALNYRKGENQSVLDYLTSIIVDGLRRQTASFDVLSRPDIGTGLPVIINIAKNPFNAPDVLFDATDLGDSYTSKPSECRNAQKFYPMLNNVLFEETLFNLVVRTSDLKAKRVQLFGASAASLQAEQLFNTIIGHAYGRFVVEGNLNLLEMTVYDNDGGIFTEGRVYVDAEKNTPVTSDTVIVDGMDLYV